MRRRRSRGRRGRRRPGRRARGSSCARHFARDQADEAGLAHQPLDALAADPLAVVEDADRRRSAATRRRPRRSAWSSRIRSVSRASSSAARRRRPPRPGVKARAADPSTRHMIVIECSAFFAAMNRKTLTGSRSPWRRRPPLFSGSRAPRRATLTSRRNRRSSSRSSLLRPGAVPSSTSSWLRPVPQRLRRDAQLDARAAGPTDRCSATAAPPPGGTPTNTAGSLASTDILPDRANSVSRCPPKRGNSTTA